MFKDFKEFIMRGNVVDLAVAVIIGTAFGKIVSSLVNDVLMPPIGLILGNVDFSNLLINLSSTSYKSLAEAKAAGAATVNYGIFLNAVVDFIIVAFVIFLLVRAVSRMKRQQAAPVLAALTTKDCTYCFSSIPIKATRCPHCTSELKVA
jgi:large conductance mechanosensitive channel